jgi:hypothetical protein
MWWHPKTDAERAKEIALLTKKRDYLLSRAPKAVLIRQAVVACFLGIIIFLFAGKIFAGAARVNLAALVAVTLASTLLRGTAEAANPIQRGAYWWGNQSSDASNLR